MSELIIIACLAAVFLSFAVMSGTTLGAGSINIGGYWENWNDALNPGSSDPDDPAYYANDASNFNVVYYAFLTLAQVPDPSSPPDEQWDGKSIYETMTQADIIEVMTETDPTWDNPYNWQRVKILALMEECSENCKKFIWSIGGYSDLTQTISDDQVPDFVDYCVNLLQNWGDGIDLDWEHLSKDPSTSYQQRRVLGKVYPALRKALDDAGLTDKTLSYTTRFNSFWNDSDRPEGVTAFASDGEGIDIAGTMAEEGSSFQECVDWVNIMMYDVSPSDLGATGAFTLSTYQMVLGYFQEYVNLSGIVMGFEPGGQAGEGVWEGMDVDEEVIDYIKTNGYGGVMFWAINESDPSPPNGSTGENAQTLAGFAAGTDISVPKSRQ